MEKFIVWDSYDKKFKEPQIEVWDTSLININDYLETENVFKSIGKQDINGQEIYADCSIVEFVLNYTDGCKPERITGYFTYNNKTCCYDITSPWLGYFVHNDFWNNIASDFKIIDTIQENKLGLVK